MFVDVWTVNKRFLSDEDFVAKSTTEQFFPMRLADQQILQDTTYFRVYDLSARGGAFQNAHASYYPHSIGGYQNRKSVVSGKRASVRVDLGGHRMIKKKK